ncbi:MAG TPA: FAD-binding domain-containing protein, partial [Halothiobacillus sp.]|nr:FAD-binding domain-containing protein [Halothiobacillus sp.]
RRWVPELARADTKTLFAPWEARSTDLLSAGIILGTTYPTPITELAGSRARALASFAQIKKY